MKKELVLVVIGILCVSVFLPTINASVEIMPTKLPQGIQAAASIWNGTNAYIFGGTSHTAGPFDQVIRYNPATDTISLMSATLPDPVCDFPAVWTGQYAYLFGGYIAPLHTSDKIVRYDPSTDSVSVMGAKLPTYEFPLYSMSAIWDGNYAYLFGGYDGNSYSDQILRYDAELDQLTTMSAKLPTGTKWMPAVWSGTYAYIFGGRTNVGASDQIVRYDPVNDLTTVLSAKLPVGILVSSAVWAGSCAYVFGGSDINDQAQSSILKYDPASDTITVIDNLPSPRRFTCAVWDGYSAYIFGGEDFYGHDLDDIVRFFLTTPATVDVKPDSLNLRNGGQWVTVYIELLGGHDLRRIDVSTTSLNGTIPVSSSAPITFGDYDNDGILDLMVKFDRSQLINYVLAHVSNSAKFVTIELTVTGYLDDGTAFKGSDTIKVIFSKPTAS